LTRVKAVYLVSGILIVMNPPPARKIRTLDVRPVLARGDEPFSLIMSTVAGLAPDESLMLVTPFLPSPLIEKLRADGFSAQPERSSAGVWRTHFLRG
jgi:hypothetical protein